MPVARSNRSQGYVANGGDSEVDLEQLGTGADSAREAVALREVEPEYPKKGFDQKAPAGGEVAATGQRTNRHQRFRPRGR